MDLLVHIHVCALGVNSPADQRVVFCLLRLQLRNSSIEVLFSERLKREIELSCDAKGVPFLNLKQFLQQRPLLSLQSIVVFLNCTDEVLKLNIHRSLSSELALIEVVVHLLLPQFGQLIKEPYVVFVQPGGLIFEYVDNGLHQQWIFLHYFVTNWPQQRLVVSLGHVLLRTHGRRSRLLW